MKNNNTISAVIPAYNSALFLPQAIASIRRQTHPIHEIIIVDDGSIDNTAEVVAGLGQDIKYLHQQNAGPAAARNHGIDNATGQYIAFLDADDQWSSQKTEQQMAIMEKQPDVALIASDMTEIDLSDKVLVDSVLRKHGMHDFFQGLNGMPVPQALALLVRKNFIPTGTVIVKKAVLAETGGFNLNIRYGEDLELWARIARRYPLVCLPEIHLVRRQHAANTTKSIEPMLRDLVKVMITIKAWGASELRSQGVDINDMAASAWADLGYWHFTHGEMVRARHSFLESLNNKWSYRALMYAIFSLFPNSIIEKLRRTKQRMVNNKL